METENTHVQGTVYNNLGSAYQSLGDFWKAIEFHQLALSVAKETGNRYSQGKTYINLGLAHQSLNDFEKAF